MDDLKHLHSCLGRLFFFLVLKLINAFVDAGTGSGGNAPVHLPEAARRTPRAAHRTGCGPRAHLLVPPQRPGGFMAPPWGLLNNPPVIITHGKSAPPPRPRSGAINNQIKPPHKHPISSVNEKICMFAVRLESKHTAASPTTQTSEREKPAPQLCRLLFHLAARKSPPPGSRKGRGVRVPLNSGPAVSSAFLTVFNCF